MVITSEMVDAAFRMLPVDAYGTIGVGEMERILYVALMSAPHQPIATVAQIGSGGYKWLAPHPATAFDSIPVGTPLYAAPVSEKLKVKQLEWHGNDRRAWAYNDIFEYHVKPNRHTPRFQLLINGQFSSTYANMHECKNAAQIHTDAAVLGNIV